MFYLNASEMAILDILIAGSGFTVVVIAAPPMVRRDCRSVWTDRFGQMGWPSLEELPRARLTPLTWIWLGILRLYLGVAGDAPLRASHPRAAGRRALIPRASARVWDVRSMRASG